MTRRLTNYLEHFRASLKIDSTVKSGVVQELYAHLEDKSHELKEAGFDEEEADMLAMQALGPADFIAQEVYEAHAQGTWQEAFFAALPHFLVALLFALYYRQSIVFLSSILVVTVGTAVYGWHQNKPLWLFPWLGYYLLPVIFTGILLIYLPEGWGWVAALVYIPLALFIIIYVMRQTAKRDWLYASLILAPIPVVFSWLLFAGIGSNILASDLWVAKLQTRTPWIVISFLALAGATVSFIRLKQRWCKIIALVAPPIIIILLVSFVSRGNINFWGWLILIFSLCAFAMPAWMQSRT